MLIRIVLLALTAHAALAFAPAATTRGFAGVQLHAADISSFEGIDLESVMGSKKFKRSMKKLKRSAKNKLKDADQATSKEERRDIHSSATAENAGGSPAASGMKLLIW